MLFWKPFRTLLQILLVFSTVCLSIATASQGAQADIRETPIVKAVRRASPAVVNISSVAEARKRRESLPGFGLNPFFDSFFRDFFDPYVEPQPGRSALGSGVIIDGERGLILTNAHVITQEGTIQIVLQDERQFEADIVGADPDFDLAVLRIETKDPLPSIKMGSSEDLMIGETVIAIGNPFGFSHTVTTGVVSALNRSIRTDERVYHEFIQIDASINPGNSGGPLLNINGDLIGINTAIYAKAQGIGFAIPISKAKKIINDLIQHGEVIEAWIGVIVQNINAGLSRYLGLRGEAGVIVKAVEAGSPAAKSGIREGDVILAVGDRRMASADDYQSAMRSYSPGHRLQMTIWRDSHKRQMSLKAQSYPAAVAENLGPKLLGIRVADIDAQSRRRYGIAADNGVFIADIDENVHLWRIGARQGDVIRRINELPIRNTEDFKRAMVKYRHKNAVIVLLQRGERAYYLTVDL